MRIAIVKLSAMGDIIHAMITLQFIKKANCDIKIDWFVEESFRSLLEYNPHIDNVYALSLKSIKNDKKNILTQIESLKNFSKNSYDLVIDAQGLVKSSIVAKLLGKNIVGFNRRSTREGVASFLYSKRIDSDYKKNVIERNIDVICGAIDLKVSKEEILEKEAFLFFEKEPRELYTYLRSEKKSIVFIIGASWSSKMYSKDKFARIIDSLKENCLVVWGGEEEKEIADEIAKKTSAIVLPKLDLNALKALIANSDLVIGNDTGPTHMAWALDVPSITIFGCTPGRRNTYVTPINKIIESDSKVDALKLNKDDYSIKDIDEERIITLAKEILYES